MIQDSLFGEPSATTDRLFFGVFPPAEAARQIEALAKDLRASSGLSGRPHSPDRFHVTLFHVGDWVGLPKAVLAQCMEAAQALRVAPFEVTFDRAASFKGRPGNRPYVLQGAEGVAGVKAMRRELGLALARNGLGKLAASAFVPHMTLLYDDKLVPERPIEPVSWTVKDFVLVHSLLGRTEHRHLQTWPLAA